MDSPQRYVVVKESGSNYAYVRDAHEGRTVKRYNIFRGDGWGDARKHANRLNERAASEGK